MLARPAAEPLHGRAFGLVGVLGIRQLKVTPVGRVGRSSGAPPTPRRQLSNTERPKESQWTAPVTRLAASRAAQEQPWRTAAADRSSAPGEEASTALKPASGHCPKTCSSRATMRRAERRGDRDNRDERIAGRCIRGCDRAASNARRAKRSDAPSTVATISCARSRTRRLAPPRRARHEGRSRRAQNNVRQAQRSSSVCFALIRMPAAAPERPRQSRMGRFCARGDRGRVRAPSSRGSCSDRDGHARKRASRARRGMICRPELSRNMSVARRRLLRGSLCCVRRGSAG